MSNIASTINIIKNLEKGKCYTIEKNEDDRYCSKITDTTEFLKNKRGEMLLIHYDCNSSSQNISLCKYSISDNYENITKQKIGENNKIFLNNECALLCSNFTKGNDWICFIKKNELNMYDFVDTVHCGRQNGCFVISGNRQILSGIRNAENNICSIPANGWKNFCKNNRKNPDYARLNGIDIRDDRIWIIGIKEIKGKHGEILTIPGGISMYKRFDGENISEPPFETAKRTLKEKASIVIDDELLQICKSKMDRKTNMVYYYLHLLNNTKFETIDDILYILAK